MSQWGAAKARYVRAALIRIGWVVKRDGKGSHCILERVGFADYTWGFHDGDEIGPKMLARIAKHTGLVPGDL